MPIYVNKLIRKIKKDSEVDIKSFYVSEKNMADRFKRDIKSKITSNPILLSDNQTKTFLWKPVRRILWLLKIISLHLQLEMQQHFEQ